MVGYDYFEEVKEDVRQWIRDYEDEIGKEMKFVGTDSIRDVEEWIYNGCFMSDSVTGNTIGSYYCDAIKAESALCHNWDLLQEAIEEYGETTIDLSKGPEHYDVVIRCYLVGQAVSEVLDEMMEEE